MNFLKKASALALCLALLLAAVGCGGDEQGTTQPPKDVLDGNSVVSGSSAIYEDTVPATVVDTDFSKQNDTMFTERDTRRDYEQGVLITLSGDTASCDGKGVTIDGNTITITADGSYTLRGEFNGGIIVNVPDLAKPQIVLDGAKITNRTGAAICILRGDKVFVLTAPNTENTLTSNGAFAAVDGENVDGALYSKQDITLGGEGSLAIVSSEHGIVGKDDVVITGGSYAITATAHGIDANDSVRIVDATLQITAGKDALHIENLEDNDRGFLYMESGSITATAEGDGVDASGYAYIRGGTFTLTAGGGSRKGAPRATKGTTVASVKGIKATGTILIEGGTLTVDSADDALHSNHALVVKGGTLTLSTGDDALHADQTLLISGGKTTVLSSYEGLEAQDIEICGGELSMKCADDGINAAGGKDGSGDQKGEAGSVLIRGGSLYINAMGDGIDANGTLTIAGGLVTVCGPTKGDTAVLDFDQTGVITGGTFIGTGAHMMTQSFTDGDQGVISLNVGKQKTATAIELRDAAGKVIISCAPAMMFEIVIISTPELVKGESYTIVIGGETQTCTAK